MCGTPAQAILDHNKLTGSARGAREGQNLSTKWPWTPEIEPKRFPQLPLINMSPFQGSLTHLVVSGGHQC